MNRFVSPRKAIALLSLAIVSAPAMAATPQQVVDTLRLAGTITGGMMPTTAPEFTQMLTSVSSGDYYSAALIAAQSSYGARFMLRRLALQMQNQAYEATAAKDNAATAYLVAHFSGAASVGAPTISKIWSDNVSCQVRNAAGTLVDATALSAADINTIDWRTAVECTAGQTAFPLGGANGATPVAIPVKHVGGYTTAYSPTNNNSDLSFASNGLTAGTNLRFVYNYWAVATGMDILSFADTGAPAQNTPRFVPEGDPNFLVGKGQTACIACHGGGLTSVTHGYSAVADVFDFTNSGLVYQATPADNQKKSYGSNPNTRGQTKTCNFTNFFTCNPDSMGVDANQGWDLASDWGSRGLLTKLGWNGSMVGQGLNALGVALGQASIVYKNLVARISREVCPLGVISQADQDKIAASGQTSDDIRQMIAQVASNAACR